MFSMRGIRVTLLWMASLAALEARAQSAFLYRILSMSPDEDAGSGEPATLAPTLHISSMANRWYTYSVADYASGAAVSSGSIWGGPGWAGIIRPDGTIIRTPIRPADPAASGLSWCQTYEWTVTSPYSASVRESALFTPIPPETWTLECLLVSGRYADPCAVKLTDGSGYRLYFTDDSACTLVSAFGTDGTNWTMESGTRFGRCTWPEVVALTNGDYRLYYGVTFSVAPYDSRCTSIVSAISTDGGLTFTEEAGERIAFSNTVYDTASVQGPAVLQLADGTFRMYYQGLANAAWDGMEYKYDSYLLSATSTDGLTWSSESMVVDGTVPPFDDPLSKESITTPEAIVMADGSTRLYFKANSNTTTGDPGVHKAVSRDGVNFHVCGTPEFTTNDMITAWGYQFGDPSLLELPDGTYRMFLSCWDVGIATAHGTITP